MTTRLPARPVRRPSPASPVCPVMLAVTALLVTVTALGAGCGHRTVDRFEPAEREGTPQVVEDERVLTERGLRGRVHVISIRETTVGGDLMRVEVDVENIRRSPQSFHYAFEWFDQDGMRVREGQWRQERLQGRQRGVISSVANTPDAVNFRLHLLRTR